MLYHWHEFSRNLMEPYVYGAEALAKMYSAPGSWMAKLPGAERIAAGYELFHRLGKDYEKPEFGIRSVEAHGHHLPVVEIEAARQPFCRLLRFKRYSDEARHVADWAPARITAIGYAVAGNFDAVAHAWRSFDYGPSDGPLTEADQLLANTGLAALDTFPDDVEELAAGDEPMGDAGIPPVVEDALALVWRCLALWVTVVGGGSLVAALS